MRPDRIILGECRAGEAFDMLQAMNTGHDGSMTTVHANTPRDALSRIEQMVGMSGIDISARSARAQIASAINVVVQVGRLSDGKRKVLSLSELTGMEGETITMQEIFRFKMTGRDEAGNVTRSFRSDRHQAEVRHGARPHGAFISIPRCSGPQSRFDPLMTALLIRLVILIAIFASVFLISQVVVGFLLKIGAPSKSRSTSV